MHNHLNIHCHWRPKLFWSKAACRNPRPIAIFSFQWLSALVLMVLFIILFGMPAWAINLEIEISHGKIKGSASQAPLYDVLSQLADKAGYTIYVDEELAETPVTFDIPIGLAPEKAIRRIVHPHSHALVFARVPGKTEPRIEQIKIYSQSSETTRYVMVTGDSGRTGAAVASYARGSVYSSTIRTKRNAVSSGHNAARSQVKPPLIITKGLFGTHGFKFREKDKGPDYRPSSTDMASAYAQYRQERKALKERNEDAEFLSAKQSFEKAKSRYQSQRTETIQQTVQTSNPNTQ